MCTLLLTAPLLGASSTLSIAAAPRSAMCPIAQSVYRDGNGQGFELVFAPPPVGSPFHATAVINHPQQSQLYQFMVSQSSGDGSVWLSQESTGPEDAAKTFWVAFFDHSLYSATPLFLGEETESPMYAVIAELGSYDDALRRGTITATTPPLLQDTLWIHDRCQ